MTAVKGVGLVVHLEVLFTVGPSGSGSVTPIVAVLPRGINTRTDPTIYGTGPEGAFSAAERCDLCSVKMAQ